MEAIGLAGSVASIVDILAKSVNFLLNLQTKYKQADLTVSLLIGQLSTLKAALNQISEWITSKGCKVLVLALDDRIKSFDRNPDHTLNSRGKAQLLWEENGTTDYLNHLSNHISALNLLLTALQCRSLFEQRDLLQSDESRRIVNQIGDDKSSLLWLRDVNSNHSRTSISTENSQMLDTIFDFDREIFNSKAYQAAIRSNMRQALSNKADTIAKRDRLPLDTLTDALDHVQLDDSEDVQTVREQSLSPFAILDEPIGDLRLGPVRRERGTNA
ncbi:hypothetical protein MMC22_005806 [Lobaria immixta]|nr:hypothetical protein [Lobaria immixta]